MQDILKFLAKLFFTKVLCESQEHCLHSGNQSLKIHLMENEETSMMLNLIGKTAPSLKDAHEMQKGSKEKLMSLYKTNKF